MRILQTRCGQLLVESVSFWLWARQDGFPQTRSRVDRVLGQTCGGDA